MNIPCSFRLHTAVRRGIFRDRDLVWISPDFLRAGVGRTSSWPELQEAGSSSDELIVAGLRTAVIRSIRGVPGYGRDRSVDYRSGIPEVEEITCHDVTWWRSMHWESTRCAR
jgi:hypothetical protein